MLSLPVPHKRASLLVWPHLEVDEEIPMLSSGTPVPVCSPHSCQLDFPASVHSSEPDQSPPTITKLFQYSIPIPCIVE